MRDKTQSEKVKGTLENPSEMIAKRSNQDLLTALDLLMELTNVSKREWKRVEQVAKQKRMFQEDLQLVLETTQALELAMLTVAAELQSRGMKVELPLESPAGSATTGR